jgi:hypothetical protein
MTDSLRARRLSLRYALAELQRCRRLSRDNIRTAMPRSLERPSGFGSPQTAPRRPHPPPGSDRP